MRGEARRARMPGEYCVERRRCRVDALGFEDGDQHLGCDAELMQVCTREGDRRWLSSAREDCLDLPLIDPGPA